jgi:oligogalacturonide lyase
LTHEFWSHDGKTIWFDLQRTKGEEFAVGGYDLASGKETVYHLNKSEASVHYNVSFDGSVFCGDGNAMAHGEIGVNGHRTLNRKWIELLRPTSDGTFHSTRLASISDNDYAKTEPNARFSPDNKLVIFTSNMFGHNYVFAVEVGKTTTSSNATN